MTEENVISFTLHADFAFFKKPDYNVGLQLSYNMLHKPVLLGVIGAVIGLAGYQEKGKLPAYYEVLKDLPVAIEPLAHERGNYKKAAIKYSNTVGYANEDGTLLVEEVMLVRPKYRCYLMLDYRNDVHKLIAEYFRNGYSEYIPYLGKNEFQAHFDDYQDWTCEPFVAQKPFTINSLFVKQGVLRQKLSVASLLPVFGGDSHAGSFTYFERLPVRFDEVLMQYELADFALTDWRLKEQSQIESLYQLTAGSELKIVQFF